jgi:hypothetical protein
MLGHALADLRPAPRRFMQLDLRVAVAIDPALHPHVEVGPHRLRAEIAAPDATGGRGDQEQADTGHDQQAGDVIEFLRPDLDPEKEEPPVRQIDQNRLVGRELAAVPAHPGQQVVDGEREPQNSPFHRPEPALDRFREDRLARLVEPGLLDRDLRLDVLGVLDVHTVSAFSRLGDAAFCGARAPGALIDINIDHVATRPASVAAV